MFAILTDGHHGTVRFWFDRVVPMATMALSAVVVDGHNGTVDSCFLFKNPLL
jgi:hypothetical protein